jgi:hypothetical protein
VSRGSAPWQTAQIRAADSQILERIDFMVIALLLECAVSMANGALCRFNSTDFQAKNHPIGLFLTRTIFRVLVDRFWKHHG